MLLYCWRSVLSLSTFCSSDQLALMRLANTIRYNSTVFSTVSTNSYLFMTVTEAFLKPDSDDVLFTLADGTTVAAPRDIERSLTTVNEDGLRHIGSYRTTLDSSKVTVRAIRADVQANIQNYRRLSNYECFLWYINPYQLRPNVLLVSHDHAAASQFNTSLLQWDKMDPAPDGNAALNPVIWSRDNNDVFRIKTLNEAVMDSWKDKGNYIQYCLQAPDDMAATAFNICRVQCAPIILLSMYVFVRLSTS